MKPPTCRVCGEPHWRNEPHRFGPKVERSGAVVSGGTMVDPDRRLTTVSPIKKKER